MITEHYRKEVVTLPDTSSVVDVATRMEREAAGCVVVLDREQHPIGVVSDRDLTLRVIAEGLDAGNTFATAVMSHPLITADPGDPLEKVIERMARHGVRRIPIVKDGALVGIVALDDLLAQLGRELDDLGGVGRRQLFEARLATGLPRLREELESRLHEMRERVQAAGGRASEVLGREFETLRDRVRRTLE